MLEVEGLSAGYGRARAIAEVGFTVPGGGLSLLLGRNGAGKSTTLKAIMGLLRPTAGTVRVDGARIDGWAPDRIARLGLAYVPEDRRLFGGLSVRENLLAGARPHPAYTPPAVWSVADILDLFPPLEPLMERPARLLSGGEQQMLAVGRALMGQPRVLLLDEPTEGLAPVIAARVTAAMDRLRGAGLTAVVAEQSPAQARGAGLAAAQAVVLDRGRAVYTGPAAQLAADERLQAKYLAV